MTRGLAVVIGMSIAYIASFAGMIFASVIILAAPIGPPILGVILPGLILGLSFFLTYLLIQYIKNKD